MDSKSLGLSGRAISMNWRHFIYTLRTKGRRKKTRKIEVKQLGLSTGKIVVVRHIKKEL